MADYGMGIHMHVLSEADVGADGYTTENDESFPVAELAADDRGWVDKGGKVALRRRDRSHDRRSCPGAAHSDRDCDISRELGHGPQVGHFECS
ncbi:hypothetical protein ASJ30_04020 [Janibacter indicus]|uniref:Uncharacterized protein n=1 Tax=Janibacter indicus TaxID=857417 RepID=A0A1L3MEL8_9MICO|nr:hypothetical protein ASJ30_04020 [Janibacter indicus]